MNILTESDRNKLSKIVGMLGSAHDGERANAASFIDAMAKRYKLTVPQLLAQGLAEHAPPPRQQAPPPPPPPPPQPSHSGPMSWSNVHSGGRGSELLDALQAIADNHSAFDFVLTQWECNFAADVAARYGSDSELSDKQRNKVESILGKIRRANGSV